MDGFMSVLDGVRMYRLTDKGLAADTSAKRRKVTQTRRPELEARAGCALTSEFSLGGDCGWQMRSG
jgi:hypothetical protein